MTLLIVMPMSTTFAAETIDVQDNLEWAKNSFWLSEWSETDFSKASLSLRAIISGGVPKDGIRSVDNPTFKPVAQETNIAETEPVITLLLNGKARAYPLRYLTAHEIVNDVFEDVPVAVTFCPLCNSSVVFKAELNGKKVEFGTTGKLHNSDLVMYDRLTQTWWQQYNGTGIVGELVGHKLQALPSRLESLKLFKQRFPNGEIMLAPTARTYGYNPYVKYDSRYRPFFYSGQYDGKIPVLARVVVIGNVGYSLAYITKIKKFEQNGLRITWQAGQNSALDHEVIALGKDVGNIVVQKLQADTWQDIPYMVSFAFAYKAFNPGKTIITE